MHLNRVKDGLPANSRLDLGFDAALPPCAAQADASCVAVAFKASMFKGHKACTGIKRSRNLSIAMHLSGPGNMPQGCLHTDVSMVIQTIDCEVRFCVCVWTVMIEERAGGGMIILTPNELKQMAAPSFPWPQYAHEVLHVQGGKRA